MQTRSKYHASTFESWDIFSSNTRESSPVCGTMYGVPIMVFFLPARTTHNGRRENLEEVRFMLEANLRMVSEAVR
jgi:hypothetical protein